MKDKEPTPALEVKEDGQIYIDDLLVSDQEVAQRLIIKKHNIPEEHIHYGSGIKPGIYPIPGLKWKKEERWKHGNNSYMPITVNVAVITPPESKITDKDWDNIQNSLKSESPLIGNQNLNNMYNPTCFFTGEKCNLKMHAIRNDEGDMVGWIFVQNAIDMKDSDLTHTYKVTKAAQKTIDMIKAMQPHVPEEPSKP